VVFRLLLSALGASPKIGFQGVRAALNGETKKPLALSSAVRLKAGLQVLASGKGDIVLAGEPSSARIRFLWLRRLVLGDTDIGALTGRLSTTAGVRGSASCLVGEEDSCETVALISRLSLVGLSKDELLMRAISASARPFRMREREASASEVR
jgi:hypothetical protein